MCRMRLSDLYQKLSTPEREKLARAAGLHAGYLYQIARRWRGKKPSIRKIQALADADRRLTVKDMVLEFSEPVHATTAQEG